MATSEILQFRATHHAVPTRAVEARSAFAQKVQAVLCRLPMESRIARAHSMITALVVLIVSAGVIGWTAADAYFEVRSKAVHVAEKVTPAVAALLSSAAQTSATLQALAGKDETALAAVYAQDGRLLGALSDSGRTAPPQLDVSFAPGTSLGFGSLTHSAPILHGGVQKGLLLVFYDLAPGWWRLTKTLLVVSLLAAAAMFLAKRLSLVFQRAILEPYGELNSIVNAIPETGSFEKQLPAPRDQEVGRLVDRLNRLFEELQDRDARLNEAKLDLELNVLTRTSELQQQIEDRKRAEIALKDSEMQYRNLFENNPVPMFVTDLESLQFLAVNHAAIQHYGYSAREFSRFTLQTLTHGPDAARVPKAFHSVARSFDAGAWRHLRKDGEIIDVQLTAHTIAFRGSIAKIVLANDVTERNRAQRALEEMNKKLVETSRQAGMAEIATGVLHNVGNVLNSVNVSAAVLAKNIQASKAQGIQKVAALLETTQEDLAAFFGPNGRGHALPRYLNSLAEQIEAERETQIAELDLLSRNITHIKEIVARQQNYAKIRGVMEEHAPRELVEEALRLTKVDLTEAGIRVHLDCEKNVSPVFADRHKVLQIFVNLISNARQAMSETPQDERDLEIRIQCEEKDGARISFRDNGCGIAPQNLMRIFNHGFTTKKEGHGFGLHGSANAAREMSGSLSVSSVGLGKGATFTVVLPSRSNVAAMEPLSA